MAKKLFILLALTLVMAVLFAGCPKKQPPPPPPPPPPPLEMATIYFEFDKYNLTDEARDIMAGNAVALSEHPDAVIRIEGHCDERGSDEYNMALGEKRAATARDYLINYGFNADNLSIISYGESRPVDPGHNEEAWAKNRRAEFIVISE